uniref:Reverse transcriptase domain-containing protein n=1 Tax=Halimeda discoidea TaxID=118222 RepID=A0A1C9JB25_9CHLO|nr:hypothetical protein [Halimeda discoidea]
MQIKQLLENINNPDQEKLENLLKNTKKEEKIFFEQYFIKYLINKRNYLPLKQLNRNTNKSTQYPNSSIFTNIYRLIYHPHMLITAYSNIVQNKGSHTAGIDRRTIDRFSLKQIMYLHNKLKTKTYLPKPVLRVWVPKPGKPFPENKRPLAVPTIQDRIVQESVRMALNNIFEPSFSEINCNFGFRPKHSPQDAIEHLKYKINGYNYAIEGDIKGAYDNIDQNILLNIISRKIKDRNLINLLNKMMKAGVLDQGKKQHSLTGVPQGSILSPLLFNIYLHELDKFITKDLNSFLQIINKKQKRTLTGKQTNELGKIRYQLKIIRKKIKQTEPLSPERKLLKQEERKYNLQTLQTKTKIPQTIKVKLTYCRYADDWILFINGPPALPKLLKNKIQSWLKTYLALELSEEKTLITNIKENWAHFLGFGIKICKTHKRIKKMRNNNITFLKRTGIGNAIFTIDIPRLESRLRIKRFMHPKKQKSYHKPEWTIFEDFRIIILYRQTLFGLFNYYNNSVNINNELYFIYHIIKNSCAKNLASKYKLHTAKKAMQKYGPNLTTYIPNTKKKISIPTFKELKERTIEKNFKPHNKDPLEITTNWKTRLKLLSYCVICSSTEQIETHHIKRLRGPTGENLTKGFDKILGAINRKQIPVCKKCHDKIHKGIYDSKSLNEIFTQIQNKNLLSL